jgi:hypothetical protein
METHEHKGPQCKSSDANKICQEQACLRDHHVSAHTEVKCTPVEGKTDLYNCVHS